MFYLFRQPERILLVYLAHGTKQRGFHTGGLIASDVESGAQRWVPTDRENGHHLSTPPMTDYEPTTDLA